MPDDDAMDRLLRAAMTAEPPELSTGFDARLLRRVRPRRLAPMRRAALAAYALAAGGVAVWLLKDLPLPLVVAAVVASVPIAAGASAYARHLVGA